MDDVFGLLAFVSLIAAQFLATVVAHSERFESDLGGGQQCATGTNRGMIPRERLRRCSAACFADDNVPALIPKRSRLLAEPP
jgi:hypothetical protein